jgi:tRNA dimethylallyltransferase
MNPIINASVPVSGRLMNDRTDLALSNLTGTGRMATDASPNERPAADRVAMESSAANRAALNSNIDHCRGAAGSEGATAALHAASREGRTAASTGVRVAADGIRVGMIVGPTGVGKTTFAIELAERLGAEIVNADSRQLYRGMDLGTAKPSVAERARVPHHLIDVCDPDRPIDVAGFATMAQVAIAKIATQGRPVLVVGGSGLYLRVLRGGICAGPPAAPAYRAQLCALVATHGVAYLHHRLQAADAEAAQRIRPNDLPRLIRALEVQAVSGVTISEHQRRHQMSGGGCVNLVVGLTVSRERLYQRIERRFEAMIAAGLVEEVRGLLAANERASVLLMRTIGYREIARYLAGELDLTAAKLLAQRESRRLAKRQMTWFRREPDLIWLDANDGIEEALRLFDEFFHRPSSSGSARVAGRFESEFTTK